MQKHNSYIHPLKNKLLEIFGVKAIWVNLQQRKHIKTLIGQHEMILAKYETILNTCKLTEDWFIHNEIKLIEPQIEELERKLHYLRREYKRLKYVKDHPNEPEPKETFVEYDKEAIKRIPIMNILKEFGHNPKQMSFGKAKYLCIFHNEKTPSFVVNISENYAHCFGCEESADVIKIYQKLSGLSFPQALKELSMYI